MRGIPSLIVVILISIACTARSESWTYKQGQTYFSSSFYYNNSEPMYYESSLYNYKLKARDSRVAQVLGWQYGIRDDLVLLMKLDVGYERNKIYLQYNHSKAVEEEEGYESGFVSQYYMPYDYYSNCNEDTELPRQFFALDTSHVSIHPKVGFRKRLGQDMARVLSTSFQYIPGALILATHQNYQIHKNDAVEWRLQYGQKYNHEFWFSQYFKDHKNKDLTHFLEVESGIKYYYVAKQIEFPLDIKFHFRLGASWALEIGLYNILNKYHFDSKPYNMLLIHAEVQEFVSIGEKTVGNMMNIIERFRNSENNLRNHNLNIRLDHYITDTQTIGVEGVTNMFSGRNNQTFLLNYSMYY